MSQFARPFATASRFRRQPLGLSLIVFSTVAIAIVPSLAKLAYEGGSNTLSVITGRSLFSVLISFLLLLILRQPIIIAKRPMLIGLAMGVAYAVVVYGYLGAVNYLPVNQVIVIYFIHPLLVGLIVMHLGQERLKLKSVVALAAALLGLCLAIGFSFSKVNPVGICLAGIAMVATAIVIVANARAMKEASAISIGFYMMCSTAVVLVVLFALFGTFALPTNNLGWIGFIGVALAATTGTLAFLCGMAHLGATRAAMISNLEPILGVLFAIAVLGEWVTWRQGIGITIVIGSIFMMELQRLPTPSSGSQNDGAHVH